MSDRSEQREELQERIQELRSEIGYHQGEINSLESERADAEEQLDNLNEDEEAEDEAERCGGA
jgi:prefoldin subunit 5